MFKVLGVVSLIIWTICATVGIVNNFDHYTIGDWIVVVILTVIPYIVYFAVKHKKKANKPSGEHAVLDAVHNTDSPQINDAQNEIANNSPIHADVTITSNPQTAYVESGSTISRADGKPISDEEVPYLIESSYQRSVSTDYDYKAGKRNLFSDNHLSKEEETFFKRVCDEFSKAGLKSNLLKITRLSSGIINVYYITEGYVGKVKIKDQTSYYIQYFIGMKVHDFSANSLNELINTIPRWVRYVRYMNRVNLGLR